MILEIKYGRVQIDEADAALVGNYVWSALRHKSSTFYAVTRVKRGNAYPVVRMHRLLMGNPAGTVDHINGDGLDNRRENLRVCTIAENCRNSRKPKRAPTASTSQFKGVFLRYGGWRAKIVKDRRPLYLGIFPSEIDAAKAYDAAAIELFGQFARTNFQQVIDE